MSQLSRQPLRRLTVLLSGLLAFSTVLPANAKPLPEVVATSPFVNNPKALVDEAWQVVNREYVDSTFNKNDWQQVRRELLARKYANNLEAYAAIRQSLRKLGDPYTRFMDPRQFESLTTQTNGEITGIGISLGESITNPKTGKIQILEIVEKSPADKAGIKVGDQIGRAHV